MKETIVIDGKTYRLIKIQREGISGVYTDGSTYLRIGDSTRIARDLNTHRTMESAGFPVPEIVTTGEMDGMSYFIETSLGDTPFSKIFIEDMSIHGAITDEHFNQFLQVTRQLAAAQLSGQTLQTDFGHFAKGLYIELVCQELPEYREKIMDVFTQVSNRLAVFPFVITHGDFNPYNTYLKGLIDFGDSLHGPFGYDLVGVMIHMDYFPASREYEYFAEFSFSPEQKRQYLDIIDSIAQENNLPKLTDFMKEFEFCRAAWLLVGLHRWPKLQQYRYELFIEKFLQK